MKQFVFFIFPFVLTLLLAAETKSANPRVTVELPLGKLEGEERTSLNGKKYFAFEGVPYAAPPTGANRFREPQEVRKWSGTKLVNNKTVECIQLVEFSSPVPPYKVEGDEDCLFLNIYSSNLEQSANLDVIVAIHGGGFMNAAGYESGPRYIMDEDVLFVTMNYRLGPLGFLSTEDGVVPGNMGMLDQIMSLNFTKKYAKFFGGNPESVTLTGVSSGAASVHFHILSPLSKGLFKRAISFSGTMINQWALVENSREKAERVAALLNCSRNTLEEAVECMRTKSAEDVAGTAQKFFAWMYTPAVPFGIVIDSWAKNPSLPEHPLKLIQQGKVQKVPWIVSHTNSEGLLPSCDFYFDTILDQLDSQWNAILPQLLDYNYTVKPSLQDSVSQKIRSYYFGSKKVSKDSFLELVQMINDRVYIREIVKAVKLHLEYVPESSIHFYLFTYRGAESECNKKTDKHEDFGASHTDDASYIYDTPFMDASTTDQDREMMKVMRKMVVSYARNGSADVGMVWPKATKEKLYRLHISGPRNLKIDEQVFTNSSFWDSLPFMENEKLF